MPGRFRLWSRNSKLCERMLRALSWCLLKMTSLFTRTDRNKRRTADQDKSIKILVTGTKGSGKTTVCLRLTTRRRKRPDCVRDTNGACRRCFHTYTTKSKFGTEVMYCELSGSGKGPYHDYTPEFFYSRAHAVIYVLDLSRPNQFKDAKESLERLMAHPFLRNKTFLVIGNKTDLLSTTQLKRIEETISERLNLKFLTTQTKTPTQTTLISAISLRPTNDLHPAVAWLLAGVNNDFSELKERVREERAIYEHDEINRTKATHFEEVPEVEPSNTNWQPRNVSYQNSKGQQTPLAAVDSGEMLPKPAEDVLGNDNLNNNLDQNKNITEPENAELTSHIKILNDRVDPAAEDEDGPSNYPAIAEFVYEEIDKARDVVESSHGLFWKKSNKVGPS